MPDYLALRLDGEVAIITLNRPDRLNAWTSAMRSDLGRMLLDLNLDESVKAVVMTGAGERAFCAGQDFNESQTFEGGGDAHDWLAAVREFYEVIRGMEKPMIAALNGVAAGSG